MKWSVQTWVVVAEISAEIRFGIFGIQTVWSLLFVWVNKKWTQFSVQNNITLDETWRVHKQNISLGMVLEIQQHGNYTHCLYVVGRTSLDVMANQLHCKWLDSVMTTFVTRATWMRENKELTALFPGVILSILTTSMFSDLWRMQIANSG